MKLAAALLVMAIVLGVPAMIEPVGETEARNEKIRDTFDSRRRYCPDNLDFDRRTGGLRGFLRY
jgi:hypothetical protein